MEHSLLLVSVADEIAALDAGIVRSVVEIEDVTPVPQAPPHVAGLAALRSRAMVVIDCRRSIKPDLPQTETGEGRNAVVVELDDFLYALLIDRVEEVIRFDGEPTALRTTLDPGWARMTSGMVETDAGPALLLDPSAIVKADVRLPGGNLRNYT